MRFTLSIDCGNVAFEHDDEGGRPELARILCDLARRIEAGALDPGDEIAARDLNGNRVGIATLTTPTGVTR